MATRLIAEFRGHIAQNIKLSEREKDVLELVGQGMTNVEITCRLFSLDFSLLLSLIISAVTLRSEAQRRLWRL
jgi:FixJ family two-component response regulator